MTDATAGELLGSSWNKQRHSPGCLEPAGPASGLGSFGAVPLEQEAPNFSSAGDIGGDCGRHEQWPKMSAPPVYLVQNMAIYEYLCQVVPFVFGACSRDPEPHCGCIKVAKHEKQS